MSRSDVNTLMTRPMMVMRLGAIHIGIHVITRFHLKTRKNMFFEKLLKFKFSSVTAGKHELHSSLFIQAIAKNKTNNLRLL